jgi:hypothetical protein
MDVDGKTVALDQPAVIDSKSERTLLPIRAVSENMGYHVQWDGEKQNVTLTDLGQV